MNSPWTKGPKFSPANVSITGGSITGLTTLSLSTGAITAGTYTPTLTNTANIAASTAFECQYLRVGATVTVSGIVNIDPTNTAAFTNLKMSLPVASNFGATSDLAGVATMTTAYGSFQADATNDLASLTFTSDGTAANATWAFTFTYQVI